MLIAAVILYLLTGCDTNAVKPEEKESTVELNSALKIHVDPRTELLAVIQHYTSWAKRRHTRMDFEYLDEVNKYFSAFAKHPAVTKSEELTNAIFNFDAPPTFVLYHSDPPEFEQIMPYSDYLIARAGGEDNLTDFANKMRDFAVDSDFMIFFNSHIDLYNKIRGDIVSAINDRDYIDIIEKYYDESKKSYNIIPTPLFRSGGYGPQVITPEGKEVYNICGTPFVDFGKPYYGYRENVLFIMLHEFSHSFVNPVTDEFLNEINKYSELFEPIRTEMERQSYGNWIVCVNEHLVRTNVARFYRSFEGESNKEAILRSEYNSGFIYIYEFDKLMAEYESNRETYITYKSFYPRFVELLKQLAETIK